MKPLVTKGFLVVLAVLLLGPLQVALVTGFVSGFADARRKAQVPGLPQATLVKWFRDRGVNAVVGDGGRVDLVGTGTSVRAVVTAIDGWDWEAKSCRITMEFRIQLAPGKEVVERQVCTTTRQRAVQAVPEEVERFTWRVLLPVYWCFIDPANPRRQVRQVRDAAGATRQMAIGGATGTGWYHTVDVYAKSLEAKLATVVESLPLDATPHWFRISYTQEADGTAVTTATMDNVEHGDLAAAIGALDWPKQQGGYSLSVFFVVK